MTKTTTLGREKSSASLIHRAAENLAERPPISVIAAKADVDADDGLTAGQMHQRLDYVLSLLQSNIVELRENGGQVRLQRSTAGALIVLEGIKICEPHKTLYSGPKCPVCA